MKRYFCLSLVLLCISLCLSARDLTVATFNMRYANQGDAAKGYGWDKRLPKICDMIQLHDFDIFGAQEITAPMRKDLLACLPGFNSLGVCRDDGADKGEASPIFWNTEKLELLEGGTFWLSETPDVPSKSWDSSLPRVMSYGHFRVRETGYTFWFFNTHFDHRGHQARLESVKLIRKKIAELAGKEAFFITGDLNCDQHSEEYQQLCQIPRARDSYEVAEFRSAWHGTANNFESDTVTDSRFDYVFSSEGFRVRKYGILTDCYKDKFDGRKITLQNFPEEIVFTKAIVRFPSDHYPVMVKVEY